MKLVSSFWLVVFFLALGWGPAFVAELLRSPGHEASFAAQHFVMRWLGITVRCTLLALIAGAIWVARFVIGRFRRRTTSFEQ